MTELTDTKLKRLVGKAVNEANAAADELEALGAPPEVVRLVRPRSANEPEYKQTHIQVHEIRLGDKIEVGGHLTTVVGVDKVGFSSNETPYVIVHALDLANRVYEIKFRWGHPLTIQRKK